MARDKYIPLTVRTLTEQMFNEPDVLAALKSWRSPSTFLGLTVYSYFRTIHWRPDPDCFCIANGQERVCSNLHHSDYQIND